MTHVTTLEQTGELSLSIEEFTEALRKDFTGLGLDEGRWYEHVKRNHRNAVEELAREFGYWCCSLPISGQFLVIHEGEQAALIRNRLEKLQTGERAVFEDMSLQWWTFAQRVADGLGLLVPSAESFDDSKGRLEIWNLVGSIEDFAAATRRQLSLLDPGEVLALPAELNHSQLSVVGEIAGELGFMCHGSAGALQVGNLAAFKQLVHEQLASLTVGESCTYKQEDDGNMPIHMQIIREVVNEFGKEMHHEEVVSKGLPVIKVARPAKAPVQDEDVRDMDADADALKEKVAQVFKQYATGHSHRDTCFLRKPDLQQFAEDAACCHRGRNVLLETMPSLEDIYDDILELQVDMGSRVSNGLTLDFFQVFLSRSSGLFGWTLITLLYKLLEIKKPEISSETISSA
jgi:hypothetical protein